MPTFKLMETEDIPILLELARGEGWCSDKNGFIAYGKTGKHTTIGPWEAADNKTAENLLLTTLSRLNRHIILCDVPISNPLAEKLLQKNSFQLFVARSPLLKGRGGIATILLTR